MTETLKGELSRRCRETRSLFTILVRTYPAMNIIWTLDPTHSSEMFEELKVIPKFQLFSDLIDYCPLYNVCIYLRSETMIVA